MWEVSNDWHVVGTGDFNGDGLTDILWRNDDGSITDWLANASGFYGNSANFLTNPGNSWHVDGTGDFNGDGKADILWRDDSGLGTDWIAEANGAFYGNSANFLAQVDNGWQIVGTGDFNGDGRTDILWQGGGQVTTWLADQNGGFYGNSANFLASLGAGWHVAGFGDFNGDGRDDILLRNDDGTVTDWLGAANGGLYGNSANFLMTVDNGMQVAAQGDFNGDGKTDVLWRAADGTISDWLGQANGSFSEKSAMVVPTDWHVAGAGDFDGDGRADILWRRTDGSLDIQHTDSQGVLTPTAEQLWEKTLANVSAFFDEMKNAVDQYSPNDQNSAPNSYYGGTDPDPMAGVYQSMLSWDPGVQGSPVSLNTLLSHTGDPLLDFRAATNFGFSAMFGTNFGSINLINPSTSEFLFNSNGSILHGSWHPDVPPADQATNGIVITGYRQTTNGSVPTGYFSFDHLVDPFSVAPRTSANGGGSGGQRYTTMNTSVAANFFADTHVLNMGVTVADEHTFELVHDDLAKFYDWVEKNPSSLIDIGHGFYINAATALLDINRTIISVTDDQPNINRGAFTQMTAGNDSATIKLNPQNADLQGFGGWISYYGDTGENFTIFHEIGHALNGFAGRIGTEAMADSAAFSIMQALGIPTPPPQAPTGGFDD